MVVVVLDLVAGREIPPAALAGHRAWLDQGFADGVFLAAGSLRPGPGGAVLAHGVARAELEARVAADPFVTAGLATATLVEFTPSRVDPRLSP